MKNATLILPYYDNPTMLLEQIRVIGSWPEKIRNRWSLIVVDDGSPDAPASEAFKHIPDGELPVLTSLYRLTVDIPWNWIGARNRGVERCGTEFFLMTDIDHLVPAETARKLVEAYHDPKTGYRFSRVSAPDLSPYHPHPNSWFMTKTHFDRVGGYDERFSGGYGTDKEFMNRVTSRSRRVVILDEVLIRVGREVIPDASTTRYERKTAKDAERKARVRAMIAENPKQLRLSFPWETVFEHRR